MSSTTVLYNLVGRDNVSRALNSAGRSADKLDSKMSKVGGTIKKASLATATGIGALAAIGKKSIGLYAEFDATIRQVGIQAKTSTKPLENLAIQLGQKTAYSAKDAADAMLELAKSGMTAAQIKAGGLASTLKLAQAGGVELADAAGYMTNSMQAFGLKSADANKIVTALAGGANASTASVQSLGLGLSQTAAGARNAGLTLNDTVAVLSAFDNAGIKGSDAGTSLKTMLQRLIPQTKKARNAMDDLGLKFTDAHGRFLDITQIAQELHDKLGPLTQAQKAQALQTIFGSDATRAATILMRNGSRGLQTYEKATRNSAIANKLAKSRMQGLSGAIENMKGAAETTAIRIGKTIAPAVAGISRIIANDVLPAVGDFVDYLGSHVAPPVGRAFDKVKPVVAGFAGWLGDTAFPLVETAMSKIGGFLSDFFAGLHKKIMPKHAVSVQDIVDVQTGIPDSAGARLGNQAKAYFDKIMGPARSVTRFIKGTLIPDFGNLASDLGRKVTPAFRDLGRRIDNLVSPAFSGIVREGKKAGSFLSDFVQGMTGHLQSNRTNVSVQDIVNFQTGVPRTAGSQAGAQVKNFFSNIFSGKNIDTGKLGSSLGKAVVNAIGWLGQHALRITRSLTRLIVKAASSIDWVRLGTQVGKTAVPFAIGFVNSVLDPLFSPDFWKKHWSDVLLAAIAAIPIGKFAGMLGKTLFSGSKFLGPITRGMGRLSDLLLKPLKSFGSRIWAGVRAGLSEAFPRLTSFFENLGERGFRKAINRIIDPIRLKAMGIAEGIGRGISAGAKTVTLAIANIIKLIVRPFGRAGSWLVGKGRAAFSGLMDGIRAGWRPVGNFLGGIKGRIVGFFRRSGSWLVGIGRDIGDGLTSGVRKALAGLSAVFLTPINWTIQHVLNPFLGAIHKIPGIPDWRIGAGGSGGHGPVASGSSNVGSNFLQHRAAGGDVAPGAMSWVGERGAELMQALPGGGVRIFPHGQSVRMARSMGQPIPGYSLGGFFGAIGNAGKWTAGKVWSGARDMAGEVVGGILRGAEKAASGAIGLIPGGKWAQSMASGIMDRIVNAAEDFVKGKGRNAPASVSGVPSSVSGNVSLAKRLLASAGWTGSEWAAAFHQLMFESGFRNTAQNPTSTAYGIAQFLNSTWASVGLQKTSDAATQIAGYIRYVKGRYGDPIASWAFEQAHNYYAKGTQNAAPGYAVVGENGAEVVHFAGGEQVYTQKQWTKLLKDARDYRHLLTSNIRPNFMPSQISEQLYKVLVQIKRHFTGGRENFLVDYVESAAQDAITRERSRLKTVGERLIRNVVSHIGGGTGMQALQDQFNTIRQRINQNFIGVQHDNLIKYVNGVNKELNTLARQRNAIAARIQAANQMAAGVKSNAMGGADITQLGTATPKATIVAFRKKMRQIMNFNYYLKRLSQRGLARGILQDLINAGPEAAPFAQQLLHMSKAQIGQLNSIQYRTNKAAAHLGTTAVNISMGGSASVNFVAGLKRQEGQLERLMDRLGKRLAKSLAHSFGIKHYARGGSIRAGQMGIVGDAGEPELFIPSTSGRIVPLRTGRAGQGRYEGPTAEDIAEAIARYMEGVTLKVDGKGLAHLVNTENLRRPRVTRG